MVRLILDILKKVLASVIIVLITGAVFPDLLTLGDGFLQSLVVLSFYVYCFIVLFSQSPDKLFHVLSIPFFTQFIHIFQRYSFTAGANSPWRLLPFLSLIIYFIQFLANHPTSSSNAQKYLICLWLLAQSFFLICSPQLELILGGGISIYLLTIPLYFLYLQNLSTASDFSFGLEKYFFILFLVLGLGTFGLIYSGAAYMGSDNLLVTRNIADTNVTMAYFILLWPFALLYALRQQVQTPFVFLIFLVFGGLIFLSFSRGAVMIGVPYLVVSLWCTGRRWPWILPALVLLLAKNDPVQKIISGYQLDYSWSLRFSDILSVHSIWDTLQGSSGRGEIQDKAWELFLEHPFLGNGTGSFEYLGPGFREAHSLYYTLLAEQGAFGALYFYGLMLILLVKLAGSHKTLPHLLVPASLVFYLIFNHTVGSVFVILPAKSISINCIAPVLLICLYFYQSTASKKQGVIPNNAKLIREKIA
jgi:hypothetical protein